MLLLELRKLLCNLHEQHRLAASWVLQLLNLLLSLFPRHIDWCILSVDDVTFVFGFVLVSIMRGRNLKEYQMRGVNLWRLTPRGTIQL